jgi:two-component system CheB/CheR fusion protein
MSNGDSAREQELARMQLYYRTLLDVLQPGIFALDANDVVVTDNKSALELWGLSGSKLVGKHVAESALATRCPELIEHIDESHRRPDAPVKFECTLKVDDGSRSLAVSLRPVKDQAGQRTGTLIYAEDVSSREKLQTTIEQLEATGEELQSANEELETTNEELQSTNEELETTNEELQSTNEELETTNEELQSLNEELENMNEELEFRTRELDQVNSRYAETIERMPWAVTVLDSDGRIQFWNSAARRLFDLEARSVIGLELSQLPIDRSLRDALVRRRKAAQAGKAPAVLRNQSVRTKRTTVQFDVHLTPLSRDGEKPNLLLMFAPQGGPKENNNSRALTKQGGKSSETKLQKKSPRAR